MPDWGVSAMVDIPSLLRTKSLKKSTSFAVDSGIPQSDDAGPSTNAAPTADPPNKIAKTPMKTAGLGVPVRTVNNAIQRIPMNKVK